MKRNDYILISALVIICLSFFVFLNFTKKEGSKLVITVDSKPYDVLDLNVDRTYTIRLDGGAYNTFEIKNGYVKMLEASCPDKLCVHQKSIHYNHETIVCLPNKVVLEVESKKEDKVDMVAS